MDALSHQLKQLYPGFNAEALGFGTGASKVLEEPGSSSKRSTNSTNSQPPSAEKNQGRGLRSTNFTNSPAPPFLRDPEACRRESGEVLSPSQCASLARVAQREDGLQLFDWLDSPTFLSGEKVVLRDEILARADALLEESEGRRPPGNPTVHQMFADAHARLGQHDLEERSITGWLRQQAPEVAGLWPEAPVTASWLDWRLHVGREHLDVLDRAFEAVTGCSIKPTEEHGHA